jgi:formiminotetrahydrofolate cyclodeaminase
MRMPKGTTEQQQSRTAAIERASQHAARVPLETAQLCADAAVLAAEIAVMGNRNSSSDAGVAALAARAGAEGAALNVLTDLGTIADDAFRAGCQRDAAAEVRRARHAADQALAAVHAALPVRADWLPEPAGVETGGAADGR